MHIYILLSATLSVKLLFSFVVYKNNKSAFARLSLPAKSVVIGGGWIASYGLLQLIEGVI